MRASSKNLTPWLAVLLALATLVLFWPVTWNGFVSLDDSDYVAANVHVQAGLTLPTVEWAFTHTVSCNWHPLTMLSHALDCQLYGLQPWGHHLTSLLLHATNAALVFLLLQRLTGSLWRSLFAAMLFAWHPLRVESVAWISERKDVLCGFFWLLTLLAYARFVDLSKTPPPSPGFGATRGPRSKIFYGAALLAFACALMSKPMAVTLPFVLLLLDFWPLKRMVNDEGRVTGFKHLVVDKIPFFALAIVISATAYLVQHNGSAMQTFEKLPPGLRFANALVAYTGYLGKFFWPMHLAIFYPYAKHLPWLMVLAAGMFLSFVSLLAWRVRAGCPYLLFGWFWFIGVLVPVIGLVQVGAQAMADRYTYLPSIGLVIALVWGVHSLASRNMFLRAFFIATGIFALGGCWIVTRQQIGYWKDGIALFSHSLAVTGDNVIARNSLGFALEQKGRTGDAITNLQAAIALEPGLWECHNNLGNLLALQNRPAEAFAEFQTALRLKPDYTDAHFNFANALLAQHQTNEAIAEFQTVARLDPEDRAAPYELGNIFAAQNRIDDAIAEFQEAVRLSPDFSEARNNLGGLLSHIGRTDDAIVQFQEAVRRKPDYAEAHYNLGLAFMKSSRFDDAISEFQTTAQLVPKFVPAHYSLGLALEKAERIDEAAAEFQTVIGLNPGHAGAHEKLGIILAASGKMDAAVVEFQTAVRLKPDYAEAQTNLARALQLRKVGP